MSVTDPSANAGVSSTNEPNTAPDPSTDDGATPEADFKAEAAKYKALSRKHEARAKENADAAKRLAELEEQDKSDAQRQSDALAAAEGRATRAEAESLRLKIALEKAPEGMSLAKVKKLAGRLAGETQEDLEADAEELFADFAPADTADDKNTSDATRRRPTERLKPGGAPDTEPEETDPTKLAAQVPRMY